MKKNRVTMAGTVVGVVVLTVMKAGAQWYDFSAFDSEWEPSWSWEGSYESEEDAEGIGWMDTEDEKETEADQDLKEISITDVQISYPQFEREYDGTRNVQLQVKADGLPPELTLEAFGTAQSADAGIWKVDCEFVLSGDGANEYWISTRQVEEQLDNLQVLIQPKTLSVWISDASKPYYEECELENLSFLDQNELEITGFVKDDTGRMLIPEEFVYPELEIDGTRLKKESGMFQNGQDIVYHGVIQLKKDFYGNYTGNTTRNYCFSPKNISNGAVYLTETEIVNGRDFVITGSRPDAFWEDETGMLWLRKGEIPQIKVLSECGFTEGLITQHDEVSGNGEIVLVRRNSYGEVIAQSEKYDLKWKEDNDAPTGYLTIDGKNHTSGKELYFHHALQVRVVEEQQKDLKKIEMMLVQKAEDPFTKEKNRKVLDWQEQTELDIKEDGRWQVKVKLTDRVGNERILESPDLILDQKEPEIQIEGLTSGSANKGDIAPKIICQDTNYKRGSLQIILEGRSTGKKSVGQSLEETEAAATIAIENFPMKKEWDDIYQLTVKAQDLAGNEAERKVTFSINRFGSTYEVEKECAEEIEKYYLKNAPKIVVKEINVDDLVRSHIWVLHDGEMRCLIRGEEYYLQKKKTIASWMEYQYLIRPSVFQEEGIYTVLLSSEDRAQNVSDNRMKNLKLEFAVDRTEPVAMITGIRDQEICVGEEEKICFLECHDNLAVEEMQIQLNGKEIRKNCELLRTLEEGVSPSEMKQQLRLEKTDEWQTLQITAVDKAGNTVIADQIAFWYGDRQPASEPLEKTQQMEQQLEEKRSMEESAKGESTRDQEKGIQKQDRNNQVLWFRPVILVILIVILRDLLARLINRF